jgi:hypothetical protein
LIGIVTRPNDILPDHAWCIPMSKYNLLYLKQFRLLK